MRVLFFISICFVFVMSVSFADSALVEAAKKEKERRAKIEANKSFTNKDVEEWKEKHKDEFGTETASAETQPAETPKTTASKDKDKAKEEDDHSTDEQYWRNKYTAAVARIQAAQQQVDQMQGYVNQWQTLGYNQADAAVRAQQLAQLDKAKEQLEAAKQALEDLQDEARRAGAPPGWVSD